MAKIQTPKLQIFTPPTPPSIGPGDTSAVARLCSRFPGIAWLMTTVLRGMMMLFNVPTSTIQSYSAWSVAFQTGILHPPRGREREAFLRLGRLSRVRIVCTLMAAYVRSQSVRINENSEEIYPQQADDVEKIEASLLKAKAMADDTSMRADRLSGAPGMWGPYANEVMRCMAEIQYSLSRIEPQGKRKRGDRRELLAAISLSTLRATVTFAGVRLKKRQVEQIEQLKRTGFDRWTGRLLQRILGVVDAQEMQPVIAWICVAEKASGMKMPRTEKALRDELDRDQSPTPLWRQVQEHVKRMRGK